MTGSVGALLLATCTALSVTGCSKKKQEDTKAEAEKAKAEADKKPQGDRYKDGQRLASSLKDWTKRWADTNDLPACDPLLKNAPDLELCKTAGAALATLKASVAKAEPEPEASLIHQAAELAFATEAASEKLREASMEKLQAEHKTAPGPSASGFTRAMSPAPSALARARALTSAGRAALAEKGKAPEATPVDPAMQVMQAYSRVNRAALRYLSQFLQFGPLPTRNVAFTELEGLSKRKETWPALGRTLREAAMAENDPDLQGKLKALAPKMSRRAPGVMPAPPGMVPGLPPGHPPAAEDLPPLPPGHPPTPGATPPAPRE
ncbi:MAG TPA: hypothetical protein VEQ58_18065 [Polyangiaceae bacterium]|nr:hypothetical protein [Polyangiaceae bacterium]